LLALGCHVARERRRARRSGLVMLDLGVGGLLPGVGFGLGGEPQLAGDVGRGADEGAIPVEDPGFELTPPISAPLPSARGTMAYPSSDSLVWTIRSVTGATASRWLCRLRESSVRHVPSARSARCTRFQIAMCTCRCGSPSRLM
jgi:hypothetical protein